MAPGAVLREELHALGDVPPLGTRRRHGRAAAERRDIADERGDLGVVEEALPAASRHGLGAGVDERHQPGPEVEVGGARADPSKRRAGDLA